MARSTCSSCKTTFTGLTAFDKHQKSAPDGRGVICSAPEKVGLVCRDGLWAFPADNNSPSPWVAASEPKTYTCACGRQFRGTGRRGRPPKSCTACGGKGVLLDA